MNYSEKSLSGCGKEVDAQKINSKLPKFFLDEKSLVVLAARRIWFFSNTNLSLILFSQEERAKEFKLDLGPAGV